MTDQQPTIGVAISGGGHRASLFGLGALLYLIDADKGAHLGSVASVSGGSLTNAFFGLKVDLATVTPDAMWRHAKLFAYQIARRGTLWAAPLTYVYLLTLALLPAAAIAVSWLCPWWAIVLAWVVVLALGGWLSQGRSAVVAAAFESTLLGKATLASMNGTVGHIICATDLQMGQDVFFSSGFVYSWRSGWGIPATMRAAQAAQASAALPGAFNVVSLPLKRFGLPEPRVAEERHPPRRFKLLDGGVYDNMGTEWLLNIGERLRDGTPPVSVKTVDEAIVVNASAGEDVTQRRWIKVPFVGEILSLLAVKDVMYRQTTAVRRRLLNVRYHIAQDRDSIPADARVRKDALRGTTIQIDRSPFELPTEFSKGSDELAQRAQAAISALEQDAGTDDARAYWAAEAEANRTVKTTLSRIGAGRAQSLIRHGYVLTLVNSHVLLGYPLHPIPKPDAFAKLVAKD
jgi:predicted acylesterase/phospholipase RssA